MTSHQNDEQSGVPRPDIDVSDDQLYFDETSARLEAAKFVFQQISAMRIGTDYCLSPKEQATYAAALDFMEKFIDGML